jgi:hypothetical protein
MKVWYSSSFDWKTSQLAIGEIPSEPLIATMNHALKWTLSLGNKKEIAKIENQRQNPLLRLSFTTQCHQ